MRSDSFWGQVVTALSGRAGYGAGPDSQRLRAAVRDAVAALQAEHADCNRNGSVAGCPWPLMSEEDVEELAGRVSDQMVRARR